MDLTTGLLIVYNLLVSALLVVLVLPFMPAVKGYIRERTGNREFLTELDRFRNVLVKEAQDDRLTREDEAFHHYLNRKATELKHFAAELQERTFQDIPLQEFEATFRMKVRQIEFYAVYHLGREYKDMAKQDNSRGREDFIAYCRHLKEGKPSDIESRFFTKFRTFYERSLEASFYTRVSHNSKADAHAQEDITPDAVVRMVSEARLREAIDSIDRMDLLTGERKRLMVLKGIFHEINASAMTETSEAQRTAKARLSEQILGLAFDLARK